MKIENIIKNHYFRAGRGHILYVESEKPYSVITNEFDSSRVKFYSLKRGDLIWNTNERFFHDFWQRFQLTNLGVRDSLARIYARGESSVTIQLKWICKNKICGNMFRRQLTKKKSPPHFAIETIKVFSQMLLKYVNNSDKFEFCASYKYPVQNNATSDLFFC